jgi:hypothetical protein
MVVPKPRSPLPDLTKLLEPGVLGFYTHIECTEVFATSPDGKAANLFTIIVAEEQNALDSKPVQFLTPAPVRIRDLPNWAFGVCRYTLPLGALLPALTAFETGDGWALSGNELGFGKMLPMPAQFVPPDQGTPISWNKLL